MTAANTLNRQARNLNRSGEARASNSSDISVELGNKAKSKNLEKRMTITLPPDAVKLLDFLSEIQGVSQVEAIRRAISTEAFVQGEIREGSKILIKATDGTIKELVFR